MLWEYLPAALHQRQHTHTAASVCLPHSPAADTSATPEMHLKLEHPPPPGSCAQAHGRGHGRQDGGGGQREPETGLKVASSDMSEGRQSLPAGHGEHVAPAASVYVIIDEFW